MGADAIGEIVPRRGPACFFGALVAGAAFALWINHNPTGMALAFYVEKVQDRIRVFTVPLPTVVILGVCSSAS